MSLPKIEVPKEWAFYACTLDGTVMIEITTNNATMINANSTTAAALFSRVGSKIKHSKRIFDRLSRNHKMLENTPINVQALTNTANGLIDSLEADYGLRFVTGDRAWTVRRKVYMPKIPALWAKYVARMKKHNLHSLSLIEGWVTGWESEDVNKTDAELAMVWARIMRTEYNESHEASVAALRSLNGLK